MIKFAFQHLTLSLHFLVCVLVTGKCAVYFDLNCTCTVTLKCSTKSSGRIPALWAAYMQQ